MKKFILMTLLSGLGLSTFAQAADKEEVLNYLFDLRREVRVTRANERELDVVVRHLDAALYALREADGGGGRPDPACVDYAYEQYYRTLNSEQSLNKAGEACRKIRDLQVAQILFDYHYKTLNGAQSMDKAAEGASLDVRGKVDIVNFAAEKYYKTLNGTQSATKAAEGAATVRYDALVCLTPAYDRYYRTLSSAQAMDKAFEFCR